MVMDEIQAYITELDQPAMPLRARAALKEGAKAHVDRLLDILRDGTPNQVSNLVTIFGELCEFKALPYIIEHLEHENLMVRMNAVQALGHFADGPIVDPLVKMLRRESEVVQMWIVKSLGQTRSRDALSPLTELLHTTPSPTIRYMTIRALAMIGDPVVVDDILPYVNDADRHVQKDARDALQALGYDRSDKP